MAYPSSLLIAASVCRFMLQLVEARCQASSSKMQRTTGASPQLSAETGSEAMSAADRQPAPSRRDEDFDAAASEAMDIATSFLFSVSRLLTVLGCREQCISFSGTSTPSRCQQGNVHCHLFSVSRLYSSHSTECCVSTLVVEVVDAASNAMDMASYFLSVSRLQLSFLLCIISLQTRSAIVIDACGNKGAHYCSGP